MRSGVLSILKIFWAHRKNVAVGIACLLITDAAQLSIPLVVRSVVDGIIDHSAAATQVGRMALLLLGLALTIALFRFAWRHFFFSTARLAERDLRRRILDHALNRARRRLALPSCEGPAVILQQEEGRPRRHVTKT